MPSGGPSLGSQLSATGMTFPFACSICRKPGPCWLDGILTISSAAWSKVLDSLEAGVSVGLCVVMLIMIDVGILHGLPLLAYQDGDRTGACSPSLLSLRVFGYEVAYR
jgi:hypothetical protein